MSNDKNSIRYRIFAVFIAFMFFASAVVFSCSIALADEAVVLESVETVDLNEETSENSDTGTLTLTWEDAYGTVYTETQEFTTTIAAPQVVELSVEAEKESATNQWWAVTIVIMVLFFLLLIAVLARKLTKKRHQMEDLLAEMEHSYDKTETK